MRYVANCFIAFLLFAIASSGAVLSAETEELQKVQTSIEERTIELGDVLLPDLTVSAISAPVSPRPGITIFVTDTILNKGTADAGASMTGFYLSADRSVTKADALLGQRIVPALAAGESNTGTASLTIPSFTPAGVYYIIAKADYLKGVPEADETNNLSKWMIKILPDLIVSSLVLPASSSAGDTITITATINNKGVVPAGLSTTRFYLSEDTKLDAGDMLLGQIDGPSLIRGQSSIVTMLLTIPSETQKGAQYIIAASDALGVITEVSEINNNRAMPFSINNTIPTVDAGSDQNVARGHMVTLDGTGSFDSDGDILTYNWAIVSKPKGSIAALSSFSDITPTFTPDKEGIYAIDLVVNDGISDSVADSVTVTTTFCKEDDVTGMAAAGSLITGASNDFIPLCNGWVLFGDRSSNTVRKFDVLTGSEDVPFQLTAAPGDLELDPANGLLYVTESPATFITKVNLRQGLQSKIWLNSSALHLTSGTGGNLFAATASSVTILNGPTGTVLKDIPGIGGSLMAYDKAGTQLITAAIGGSSLSRYAFNDSLLTLTKTQSLSYAGANGQDLAISPDGNHIAFPCGGGNGAGYTIFDFASDDLNAIYGEWNTGAYPSSAAFDPTGRYIVATDSYTLQVFDVLTHAKIKEYSVNMSNCDYSDLKKVGFSRGGKIVYAFSNCGFDDDHGKLFWAVFEP